MSLSKLKTLRLQMVDLYDAHDPALVGVPRLVRHAHQAIEGSIEPTVAAEVAVLCPEMAVEADEWANGRFGDGWQALAAGLDERAIREDKPALRGLADSVRLASMTVDDACARPEEALRLSRSLHAAKRVGGRGGASSEVLAVVERCMIGWLSIAAGEASRALSGQRRAHTTAHDIGLDLAEAIGTLAEPAAPITDADPPSPGDAPETAEPQGADGGSPVPGDGILVCRSNDGPDQKFAEAIRGHAHVVGARVPLATTPDLSLVRRTLVEEYPYAVEAVDRLIAPLVGQSTVRVPPTILVGPPGSGKSRLARRLSETLEVGLWRTDAGRSDNSCFGGTDRRWSTAEVCHPFQAISRFGVGNPLVLVDEVEKAGVGRHNGRLWDSLLNFLEPETAATYPDPHLLVPLDLSHVGYVLTCNAVGGLPEPLLDRCRVIDVPAPASGDLPLLLPAILRRVAAESGLDDRWIEPFSPWETALIARRWRGGSIRHLGRLAEIVLRARDRCRSIH